MIWIAAARLEETRGQAKRVPLLIERALISLRSAQVEINRKQWLEDAVECELSNCPLTSRAIMYCIFNNRFPYLRNSPNRQNVIAIGVEDEDRKHTWMEDAEWFITQRALECARAVYAFTLNTFPKKKGIWTRAAFFEREVINCWTGGSRKIIIKKIIFSRNIIYTRDYISKKFF